MLVGRGELLEDRADLAGQPAQPHRLVVIDGEQPAERQGRERQRQLLHQVHRAAAVRRQPVHELCGDLPELGPVQLDLARGEEARGTLAALSVLRSAQEHHRAVQAPRERVVPPARAQRVELPVRRRAERRVAQQPRAARVAAHQVGAGHPGETDGQHRRQVEQPGVQRIRVGERVRADQFQEDPQRFRLLRPVRAGPAHRPAAAGCSSRRQVPQNPSRASASSAGCSMLGLCEARSITTRGASRRRAISS